MDTGLGMEGGTDGHRTRDGRWTDGHKTRDGRWDRWTQE